MNKQLLKNNTGAGVTTGEMHKMGIFKWESGGRVLFNELWEQRGRRNSREVGPQETGIFKGEMGKMAYFKWSLDGGLDMEREER